MSIERKGEKHNLIPDGKKKNVAVCGRYFQCVIFELCGLVHEC